MTNHIHRLRERLAARRTKGILTVPGCWDGMTALLIEQAGFEAAFLTGGGLSMARLGRPDVGLVTASELVDAVAQIRDRTGLPLMVDGDTGFGSVLTLARTVRQIERAGASAVQIEDQTYPKRCGHLAGKGVASLGEAVGRIAAALDARHEMLVIARTDAVAVEGIGAALDRADAYREAGADLIFVEGPRTIEEMRKVVDRFGERVPLVHNLVEGGTSATARGNELGALGFAVALHPLVLLHGFAAAAPEWLTTLRDTGSTESFAGDIANLADMNRITGLHSLIDDASRFASIDNPAGS